MNGGFTGSERDRLLVQIVAAYAEGQLRYGRAVQLLDEVESNALLGEAPVPPNVEMFQVPQDFHPVDEDGKPHMSPGGISEVARRDACPREDPSGRSRRATVPRWRRRTM